VKGFTANDIDEIKNSDVTVAATQKTDKKPRRLLELFHERS